MLNIICDGNEFDPELSFRAYYTMRSVDRTGLSLDQRFFGYDWVSGKVYALPDCQLAETRYGAGFFRNLVVGQ